MNDIGEFMKTCKEAFNVWYKRETAAGPMRVRHSAAEPGPIDFGGVL